MWGLNVRVVSTSEVIHPNNTFGDWGSDHRLCLWTYWPRCELPDLGKDSIYYLAATCPSPTEWGSNDSLQVSMYQHQFQQLSKYVCIPPSRWTVPRVLRTLCERTQNVTAVTIFPGVARSFLLEIQPFSQSGFQGFLTLARIWKLGEWSRLLSGYTPSASWLSIFDFFQWYKLPGDLVDMCFAPKDVVF